MAESNSGPGVTNPPDGAPLASIGGLMIFVHHGSMDGWHDISADTARARKLDRMLLESARPHLRNERVRAVLRGQTRVSPVVLPLVAPLLLFFLVKSRSVIVTDRSIITVQESMWLQSKVTRVVSHYPLGGVAIHRTRLGLKIGDDPTVYAMPGDLSALGVTASAASRAVAMNGARIQPV